MTQAEKERTAAKGMLEEARNQIAAVKAETAKSENEP